MKHLAGGWGRRLHHGNYDANLRFLEKTEILTNELHLLEVGSGNGGLLHELRSQGYDVQGVEINAEAIAHSREQYGELPLFKVDSHKLPFPDGVFDVVMSFDVFEHIPDSDAHLTEVDRVLKPGGRYVFVTPNKWLNSVFETIRHRSFTRWQRDHCSLHSYRQLRTRFRSHGYEIAFFDIPVVTDYFRAKLRRFTGPLGPAMLRVADPDRFPIWFRTNFFCVATKDR